MTKEIVIAPLESIEQNGCGQVTNGFALEADRDGICISYADSEGDQRGTLSVVWEEVLKHAPKSAMLKELWNRTHPDGTSARPRKGYRFIPKGCPTCGGDLFQMHFPFGQKTLTCLECDGKVTYEREADLKAFPPSRWI